MAAWIRQVKNTAQPWKLGDNKDVRRLIKEREQPPRPGRKNWRSKRPSTPRTNAVSWRSASGCKPSPWIRRKSRRGAISGCFILTAANEAAHNYLHTALLLDPHDAGTLVVLVRPL